MKKADYISDPTSPLNLAADDEPVFFIRATDAGAQNVIEWWASLQAEAAATSLAEATPTAFIAAKTRASVGFLAARAVYEWNAVRSERAAYAIANAAANGENDVAAAAELADVAATQGGPPTAAIPVPTSTRTPKTDNASNPQT